METKRIALCLVLLALLWGCCEQTPRPSALTIPHGFDSLLVDTITYDIILKQIDPEDVWTGENLKNFDHLKLIDYLMDGVYAGRYAAVDIITEKKLNAREIKRIEDSKGYDRSNISKAIFKEVWYMDSLGVLNKRVHSISLGIEARSDQGTFLGHKPLFRVEM